MILGRFSWLSKDWGLISVVQTEIDNPDQLLPTGMWVVNPRRPSLHRRHPNQNPPRHDGQGRRCLLTQRGTSRRSRHGPKGDYFFPQKRATQCGGQGELGDGGFIKGGVGIWGAHDVTRLSGRALIPVRNSLWSEASLWSDDSGSRAQEVGATRLYSQRTEITPQEDPRMEGSLLRAFVAPRTWGRRWVWLVGPTTRCRVGRGSQEEGLTFRAHLSARRRPQRWCEKGNWAGQGASLWAGEHVSAQRRFSFFCFLFPF
jgi:hypothetical protein